MAIICSLPLYVSAISISVWPANMVLTVDISCKHLLTKCRSGCTKARHFKWKKFLQPPPQTTSNREGDTGRRTPLPTHQPPRRLWHLDLATFWRRTLGTSSFLAHTWRQCRSSKSYLILTNLSTVNTIPPKHLTYVFITTSHTQLDHKIYHVSAFLTAIL